MLEDARGGGCGVEERRGEGRTGEGMRSGGEKDSRTEERRMEAWSSGAGVALPPSSAKAGRCERPRLPAWSGIVLYAQRVWD